MQPPSSYNLELGGPAVGHIDPLPQSAIPAEQVLPFMVGLEFATPEVLLQHRNHLSSILSVRGIMSLTQSPVLYGITKPFLALPRRANRISANTNKGDWLLETNHPEIFFLNFGDLAGI